VKWHSHVWEYPERGFLIHKWWTLTGNKDIYYSCYESLQTMDRGIVLKTTSSLKDSKDFFKNLIDSGFK